MCSQCAPHPITSRTHNQAFPPGTKATIILFVFTLVKSASERLHTFVAHFPPPPYLSLLHRGRLSQPLTYQPPTPLPNRPTRADHFGLGQDMVFKNPAAASEGSGKPLPWPFGPHVAVNKYQTTHTPPSRKAVERQTRETVTPLVDGYHIEEAGKLRLGPCRVYHPTAALV